MKLHLANFSDCWSRWRGRRLHAPQQKLLCWEKNKLPVLQWKPVSKRVFSFSGNRLFCFYFLRFYIFMCSNCCLPCLIFKSSDPSLCESPLSCVMLNMPGLLCIGFLRELQPCPVPLWQHPPGSQEINILQGCSLLYGLPSLSDYIWMSSIWWLAPALGV